MAKTRKSTKSPAKPKNRRGSPEAIEKRKAARRLNTLLDGGGKGASKLDGRTEKRRQRLITELKEGKGGKNLKSMEVLTKVDDLVKLGENFSSLKRAGVKVRRSPNTAEIISEAERVQSAYGFAPEAWKFLGITVGETKAAPKKAAPKRKAAKRAARKR
ncbi:MAG: hypothetical protein GXP55_14235 [Deltaproteobacteria bacterium]|nr:hypothetical protein [Deltaproteobacteria bacterium]